MDTSSHTLSLRFDRFMLDPVRGCLCHGAEEIPLRPKAYDVLRFLTAHADRLVTKDEIPNPGSLNLRISVNGEERQNSNTKYLILGVPELIEYASSFYTLYPGDIISTGTPGAVVVEDGDIAECRIDGLGRLSNPVRRRRS